MVCTCDSFLLSYSCAPYPFGYTHLYAKCAYNEKHENALTMKFHTWWKQIFVRNLWYFVPKRKRAWSTAQFSEHLKNCTVSIPILYCNTFNDACCVWYYISMKLHVRWLRFQVQNLKMFLGHETVRGSFYAPTDRKLSTPISITFLYTQKLSFIIC